MEKAQPFRQKIRVNDAQPGVQPEHCAKEEHKEDPARQPGPCACHPKEQQQCYYPCYELPDQCLEDECFVLKPQHASIISFPKRSMQTGEK